LLAANAAAGTTLLVANQSFGHSYLPGLKRVTWGTRSFVGRQTWATGQIVS
jgi:hypothetical protein